MNTSTRRKIIYIINTNDPKIEPRGIYFNKFIVDL